MIQLRLALPRRPEKEAPAPARAPGRPRKGDDVRPFTMKVSSELIDRLRAVTTSEYRELMPDFADARTLTSLIEMGASMVLAVYEASVAELKRRKQ